MKDWIKNLGAACKNGVHSQSYQDSLLVEVFKHIGTRNTPPFCVEFGFNHPELVGGSGSNVARLVVDEGWKSLLLDAEHENEKINLKKHFLTPGNICQIFQKYNVPSEPEYISIDIDSADLWLFEALVKEYRAMIFSVEYNANYPLDSSLTFPKDTNEYWRRDRGYGASLKALVSVANRHGYSLLWVVRGLDAFFIRNDLIEDGTGELAFPYDTWKYCTNITTHPAVADPERLKMFMDYEVFVKTGSMQKSQEAAQRDALAYLTDSFDLGSVIRRGPRRSFRILRNKIKKLVS